MNWFTNKEKPSRLSSASLRFSQLGQYTSPQKPNKKANSENLSKSQQSLPQGGRKSTVTYLPLDVQESQEDNQQQVEYEESQVLDQIPLEEQNDQIYQELQQDEEEKQTQEHPEVLQLEESNEPDLEEDGNQEERNESVQEEDQSLQSQQIQVPLPPILNTQSSKLVNSKQAQKQLAQAFITHGSGILNAREATGLDLRPNTYHALMRIFFKNVFTKVTYLLFEMVARSGATLLWKDAYKTPLMSAREWMSKFQFSIFVKVIFTHYRIKQESISKFEITQLYQSLRKVLVKNTKRVRENLKGKKRSIYKKASQKQAEKQQPSQLASIQQQICQLYVAYKDDTLVGNKLTKRYSDTNWLKLVVQMAIKQHTKQGLLLLIDLASQYQQELQQYPTLDVNSDNIEDRLMQLEHPSIRGPLIQLNLAKKCSPYDVSELIKSVNIIIADSLGEH